MFFNGRQVKIEIIIILLFQIICIHLHNSIMASGKIKVDIYQMVDYLFFILHVLCAVYTCNNIYFILKIIT